MAYFGRLLTTPRGAAIRWHRPSLRRRLGRPRGSSRRSNERSPQPWPRRPLRRRTGRRIHPSPSPHQRTAPVATELALPAAHEVVQPIAEAVRPVAQPVRRIVESEDQPLIPPATSIVQASVRPETRAPVPPVVQAVIQPVADAVHPIAEPIASTPYLSTRAQAFDRERPRWRETWPAGRAWRLPEVRSATLGQAPPAHRLLYSTLLQVGRSALFHRARLSAWEPVLLP